MSRKTSPNTLRQTDAAQGEESPGRELPVGVGKQETSSAVSDAELAVVRRVLRGFGVCDLKQVFEFLQLAADRGGPGMDSQMAAKAVGDAERAGLVERTTNGQGFALSMLAAGWDEVAKNAATIFGDAAAIRVVADPVPRGNPGSQLEMLRKLIGILSVGVGAGVLDSVFRSIHKSCGIEGVDELNVAIQACPVVDSWRRISHLTAARRREIHAENADKFTAAGDTGA